MRYTLAIFGALVVLGAAAPGASASYVCQFGSTAVYESSDVIGFCSPGGGAVETNNLTVERAASGGLRFTDSGATITPGAGCTVTANVATCPGASDYFYSLGGNNDIAAAVGQVSSAVDAFAASDGGLGDDRLTGGALVDALAGGGGKDAIEGGPGEDVLRGGPGDDVVTGGPDADSVFGDDGVDTLDGGDGSDTVESGLGNDTVRGGNGDDFLEGTRDGCADGGGTDGLDGGPGNDVLCGGPAFVAGGAADNDALTGGPGLDAASYRGRNQIIGVSLDGLANDGAQNEGDNVSADVEVIVGGSAGDDLAGGDGIQLIDGGPGGDTLRGGGGDDILTDSGTDGAGDLLEGGPGDDLMAAGGGPDTYSGGDGTDGVTDYAGRVGGVSVTLDDAADDGESGEGDNVRGDVEDVVGGQGADNLRGSAADNELTGNGGADQIDGGPGNDGLHGGPGADALTGGLGSDQLDGGGGNDVLNTRDGLPDRALCGGGTDRAEVDGRDDAFGDCETIDVPRPAAVVIRSAVASRAGLVIVDIACPGTERACAGGVTIKSVRRIAGRVRTLGIKSYRILGGRGELVRATIPQSQRLVLKRARRVKVRVIVTNYNSATGERSTAARSFTVRTSGLSASLR